MRCCRSPGVRRLRRFGGVVRPLVALTSASSLMTSRTLGLLLRQKLNRHPCPPGFPKVCQSLSISLAFSTSPARVVGCGDTNRSLLCISGFRFLRKANIFDWSSMWDFRANWLHSWYHSLNSLFPMARVCTCLMASAWVSGGMNCSLKSALMLRSKDLKVRLARSV